ncbi:MAG TPA: hypothetical protein VGJ47_06830 [Gemmatimonadaceae bacterium]|jgi:hypothetical protein
MVYIPAGPGTQPITIAAPRTARDLQALRARRSELSDQLQSVDSRRSKLMSQLRNTSDPTATQGLESRLALLDARQLQLETDLAQTGQLLSSASAGAIASTSLPAFVGGLSSNQVMGLSVLSIIFVLFPLAIGVGRAIFKRSNKPGIPPQVLTETAQRLERLESSVDAIAIEIERISEGQRFVTKLLSDGQAAPMLGSGQRSPEAVRAGSTTK